ncbi:HNH endonuclease signature motif containing protein [Rathayibacter sp. CAU 1779]
MTTPIAPVADLTVAHAARLAESLDELAAAIDEVLGAAEMHGLGDEALLAATRAVESLGRRVDSLRLHCAAEITERSAKGLGSERLSARMGCRTPAELIARVTGASEATASRRASLGTAIAPRDSLTGGELPPRFPAVAWAVASGELGEDSARVIVSMLGAVEHRADRQDWSAAETQLVADAVAGFTADQTKVQATVWQAALDPDGVETDAEDAMRRRGLTRVGTHDGLVRYRMDLVPEISGKLEQAIAAIVSPKSASVFLGPASAGVSGEGVTLQDVSAQGISVQRASVQRASLNGACDERTSAQKRHDAFASLIDAASRSTDVASMGGAAPTVLVTVKQSDLLDGRGAGWIDGVDDPIPMVAVTQFACTGGIQKMVLNADGAILSLWSPERCFTPQQRRAIAVRDGGCVIPGCRVPASWCEVHHVREHSRGGPTHTSNGVTLCWFHHRSIDTGGWSVRMRGGVPQVRAPGWVDPGGEWRAVGQAGAGSGVRWARRASDRERQSGAAAVRSSEVPEDRPISQRP